jgi:hypothetical protein
MWTPNAHENTDRLDWSYGAGENVKYYSDHGKYLVVSYKTKCAITTQPRNCTPRQMVHERFCFCSSSPNADVV